MMSKIVLVGLVGSAAAFNAPMMTVRRDAIATGAAAAVVAPILRPAGAAMKKNSKAPCVTIFDERDGCGGPTRAKTGAGEEGLMVKIQMQEIKLGRGAGAEYVSIFTNYDKKLFGVK
uniref:Phycoerythrin alpha-3 subunit n=1 Tax=Hemiselmis andersenii TaxID=464988 RepID=PHEA3_HEMAN|nr:RecName: Full=Phycoerythrin alpha-3 subunit [Hemiselmis andersenii]AGY96991.1 phycoerythrin550 alpha subunit [Hemiselmis andersenii]